MLHGYELEGIRKTPAGPGPGTEYQDSLTIHLNKMHKDATNPQGRRSSDEIYQEYLARYNEEKERAASSRENGPKAHKKQCRTRLLRSSSGVLNKHRMRSTGRIEGKEIYIHRAPRPELSHNAG